MARASAEYAHAQAKRRPKRARAVRVRQAWVSHAEPVAPDLAPCLRGNEETHHGSYITIAWGLACMEGHHAAPPTAQRKESDMTAVRNVLVWAQDPGWSKALGWILEHARIERHLRD